MIQRKFHLVLAVASLLGGVSATEANGDLCASDAFRAAFLEGQGAADFPTIGPKLKSLGDAAVPCLKAIAENGNAEPGISECTVNPRKCKGWAVLSLSAVGTPNAQRVLLALLDSERDPVELAVVMGGVTTLHLREAAPNIRRLLKHESPYVRSHAVLDLGTLGSQSDFEAMAASTRSLPWDQMNRAIRGLELLGDPRTIDVLDGIKARVTEPTLQAEIQRTIDRIRSGKGIQPSPGA
jgi:hypothetical protein